MNIYPLIHLIKAVRFRSPIVIDHRAARHLKDPLRDINVLHEVTGSIDEFSPTTKNLDPNQLTGTMTDDSGKVYIVKFGKWTHTPIHMEHSIIRGIKIGQTIHVISITPIKQQSIDEAPEPEPEIEVSEPATEATVEPESIEVPEPEATPEPEPEIEINDIKEPTEDKEPEALEGTKEALTQEVKPKPTPKPRTRRTTKKPAEPTEDINVIN